MASLTELDETETIACIMLPQVFSVTPQSSGFGQDPPKQSGAAISPGLLSAVFEPEAEFVAGSHTRMLSSDCGAGPFVEPQSLSQTGTIRALSMLVLTNGKIADCSWHSSTATWTVRYHCSTTAGTSTSATNCAWFFCGWHRRGRWSGLILSLAHNVLPGTRTD